MDGYILLILTLLLVVILLKLDKTKLKKPFFIFYLNLILISFIIFFSYQFIYNNYLLKPNNKTIEYFVTKLNKNSNIENIKILKIEKKENYHFDVTVAYKVDELFCTSEIKIIYENEIWIGKKEKIEKCNRVYKI